MHKVGSPEAISEMNKHLILEALRLHGQMSRADLSRHLHLSFPAVSSNAKGLLDANFIKEVGVGGNAIGRKSTLLAFNGDRGYIIGVDMGRFRVRAMLADLLGNEIARTETVNTAHPQGDGGQSIRLIREQIGHVLDKAGKHREEILCIVIGIPGVIKDGQTYLTPFTEKYSEEELRQTLLSDFTADVLIENSVNLGAMGEQWRGAGIGRSNITYVAYGVGLGSAHIIDGKLYRGANGAAGEIGFMLTDPLHIRKTFDEVGPLEEALSRSKISRYLQSGNFDDEIVKLMQQYNDGDPYAKLIVDEIALHFGMALVNMCAVLNPEVIIISGGLGVNLGQRFVGQWKELLSGQVPFVPDVLISQMEHTESMLGAVMTGIIHIHQF